MNRHAEIEHALKVFVVGFSKEKSRTHPYEHFRVGKIWVMRDGERKNPRDYRKEEWIAFRVPPEEVDAAARRQTRGRFFVCAIGTSADEEADARLGYKSLGYRLLVTETLFVHPLRRILRAKASEVAKGLGTREAPSITIEQIKSAEMAARFGKATRTRPIPQEKLGKGASFRQYVALDGEEIVGWVSSINAVDSTWCSNMYVRPTHRRRGIGKALLSRMLNDDRRRGSKQSVLLSSHTGALLYSQVGYEQIGVLLIFAPRRK